MKLDSHLCGLDAGEISFEIKGMTGFNLHSDSKVSKLTRKKDRKRPKPGSSKGGKQKSEK